MIFNNTFGDMIDFVIFTHIKKLGESNIPKFGTEEPKQLRGVAKKENIFLDKRWNPRKCSKKISFLFVVYPGDYSLVYFDFLHKVMGAEGHKSDRKIFKVRN